MFEDLKNPSAQFRPAPFWIWNEVPNISEIERQLEEMQAKGIGGFFIDGRITSRSEQTEAELVQITRETYEIAERLGLHVYNIEKSSPLQANQTILQDKLASSAAHLSGQNRIIARLPRKADWSLSLSDLKQSVDLQACLGANFFCPGAFYYSIAGQVRPHLPPSQFYQTTYWDNYKHLSDYAARLSSVLSQGKHKAQAALLMPGSYNDRLDTQTTKWLHAYCLVMIAQHVDFDIIDEAALARALSLDEQMQIGDEAYQLLVMPPLNCITGKSAEKIRAFVDEGGKLVGTMKLPSADSLGEQNSLVREAFDTMFDPEINPSTVHFLEIEKVSDLPDTFAQALRLSIKRNISLRFGGVECQDIVFTHRATSDADLFFLCNQSPDARDVKISVRCDGAPNVIDLESGGYTALQNCTQQGNRTILLHRFEGHSSLMIAFDRVPSFAVSKPPIEEGQEITISSEWDFALLGRNCSTLNDWAFNTLIQNDAEIFEYTTTFAADYVPRSLLLVLERTRGFEPESGLAVFVNDEPVKITEDWVVDVNFKTAEIAAVVVKGINSIRMTVQCRGWTGDPIPTPAKPRIMGDFSLTETDRIAAPRSVIFDGSWTEQGYPYYSGTAAYSQNVQIPAFARGQRIMLCAHISSGAVEFVVNGAIASVRPWSPYEADITALVKPGANHIELRVTNSLANMLHNRPLASGLTGGATAFLT